MIDSFTENKTSKNVGTQRAKKSSENKRRPRSTKRMFVAIRMFIAA